jgi:hypothetical protein
MSCLLMKEDSYRQSIRSRNESHYQKQNMRNILNLGKPQEHKYYNFVQSSVFCSIFKSSFNLQNFVTSSKLWSIFKTLLDLGQT